MQSPENLIKHYRQKGLRITPQRRFIFELLANTDMHPTVDEIYQQLKSQMPEISRSTVYNTVHELVDLGEVKEVGDFSAEGTRYDTETEHQHHHLYCRCCHKLIDLLVDLDSFHIPPEKTAGFKIERNQVTFYGLCVDCQD
jgi:Fe2+ or Zn2+ uptake regulation protein